MRFACIVIFMVSAISIADGQNIARGRVLDSKTREPLAGVYVIAGKEVTTTDTEGSYLIDTGNDNADITFQFIGYQSITKKAFFTTSDTVDINVDLDLKLQEIGQIVVSASRNEQKVAELSVSMDILKSSDFLKPHITDAQELVNRSSGIEVMDGQVSIRGGSGFSYGAGSRVLALIDGLPMIAPDAGNIKWQFLPLENISQVEIIKGASSVLYGSSALNGIINFRSADAGAKPKNEFFAETGIFGNPRNMNWKWWSSPRLFSNISYSHLAKYGKTDIGFGLNLLSDRGYRKYNDESLVRASLRLKHFNGKIRGLSYGMNINSGYTPKIDFILWEDADYGALKQDTSTVAQVNGSYLAIDPFISLHGSGKFSHDLRARIQYSKNSFPVRVDNNSLALMLYAEYQASYRVSEFINLTAGITENYSSTISNFYGDHTGLNIAGFTQAEIQPVSRLKIVAGIRVEQNSIDGINDKVVPILRTGINWQAADYTFLRASFGQGYRYPSIAEKFASTTLGSVKIFPNPYVEAESGWSTEAGIKQGLLFGNVSGQADLSVFMSENIDMIEYLFGSYPDPVTGIFSYGFLATNVEYSRVYGTELEFSLTRPMGQVNTTLSGGYTYIYPVEINPGTHKSTGNYLKYRRKHSATIGISTSIKKMDIGLNLFARSKILRIDDVFLNELTREEILPGFYDYWLENDKGYFTMDGHINYNIKPSVGLSLAVKNITNAEYMGRPGDIQPQRNYSIRLTVNF